MGKNTTLAHEIPNALEGDVSLGAHCAMVTRQFSKLSFLHIIAHYWLILKEALKAQWIGILHPKSFDSVRWNDTYL